MEVKNLFDKGKISLSGSAEAQSTTAMQRRAGRRSILCRIRSRVECAGKKGLQQTQKGGSYEKER